LHGRLTTEEIEMQRDIAGRGQFWDDVSADSLMTCT